MNGIQHFKTFAGATGALSVEASGLGNCLGFQYAYPEGMGREAAVPEPWGPVSAGYRQCRS